MILEPLVFQDDRLVFYGVPGFRGSSNREVEYLKHGTTRFRGLRDYSNYELIILAHINTKFAGYDPSRYSKRYGQLYMEYEDFLHKLPENTRYIALGHVHLPIPMDDAFKGKIAYPGAPIGLDTADLKETFELGKISGFRSDSDIDVLIVTKLASNLLVRGALFKAIAIEIDLDNPFELHIVTEEEYLRVYRRFIDVSQEIT